MSPPSHRKLAHLNALRAVEAAARHLSFTRAADELSVTPGAISQQVRLVEEYYGVKLFRRFRRGIALTEKGAAAFSDLAAGFDSLAAAAMKLQSHTAGGVLTVSAPPTLALKWLVPRLGQFRADNPLVEVSVESNDRLAALKREGVDVAIRYGRGPYPGLSAEKLHEETLTPACSPAYVERLRLSCPEDLSRATLIHDRSLGDQPSFPTWDSWLGAAGVNITPAASPWHFSSSVTATQAAIDGHGVVLSRSLAVKDDLACGKLVAPFETLRVPGWSYWLVCAPEALDARKVRAFRTWVVEQFRARAG